MNGTLWQQQPILLNADSDDQESSTNGELNEK